MLFKITNGNFSYGSTEILKNFDFEIKDNEKIAICGRNGSGKTTLLKIISGLEEFETNDKTSLIKVDIKNIGYLKQVAFTDENITMEEEILKNYSSIISMEKELNLLQKKLETSSDEKLIKEYSTLYENFTNLGGYYYQKEYNAIIKAFNFSDSDKTKKLCEFSGGQKTKIAFICLLLQKPDILLLDEPTNHLDINTIEWLEDYLQEYKNSVVIVSHDREFLDKTVNVVYEIEYNKMTKYIGNYSDYVLERELNYISILKDYTIQQQEIERLTKLIDRFRYKKNKAKMAQSKIKYLERMDKVELPQKSDTKTFKFSLQPNFDSGKDVLTVKNLTIGYDNPLATLNFKIMRNKKVGILGDNGIGKSTLLKTLVGKVPMLSGSYNYGHNVDIGYFEQQNFKHTQTISVLEDYREEFPKLNETQLRKDLGCFLFTKENVEKPLNTLSGGEMVRLQLLKIFKHNPNFLILDEPTNHLDILSKETLENMLIDYPGTLLTVSHDRYFLRKLCDMIIEIRKDKVNIYEYGYNEYEEKKQKEKLEPIIEKKIEEKPKSLNEQNYLLNKEKAKQKRMANTLEEKISKLESEIEDLKKLQDLPEYYENMDKYLPLIQNIEEKEKNLENLYEKWYELTDNT